MLRREAALNKSDKKREVFDGILVFAGPRKSEYKHAPNLLYRHHVSCLLDCSRDAAPRIDQPGMGVRPFLCRRSCSQVSGKRVQEAKSGRDERPQGWPAPIRPGQPCCITGANLAVESHPTITILIWVQKLMATGFYEIHENRKYRSKFGSKFNF
jgi:hypothetical protein